MIFGEKFKIENYLNIKNLKMEYKMAKNKPKRDGSGKGVRANKGRSGCKTPRKSGKR